MIRWILFSLVGLALLVYISLELMLDRYPAISQVAPPSPEDVYYTRAFVEHIRAVTEGRVDGDQAVALTEADANALLRVGARMLPRGAGQVMLTDEMVWVEGTMEVPWPLGRRWINLSAAVLPFKDEISLNQLIVGGIRLPPGLMIGLAQRGADLVTDNQLGTVLIGAASEMLIIDESMVFSVSLSPDDRGAALDGLFGVLRGGSMPDADTFVDYYVALRVAMDNGDLPQTGSFVPYIRYALQSALEGDEAVELPDRYTAAMFSLTWACGSVHTAMAIGRLGAVPQEAEKDWQVSCEKLTLHGREDLRRHFVTAAAIQAASNRGVSVSAGEFKELIDSIGTGRHSGFDFTDIVANNSGIRLSNLLMSTQADQWPVLIELINTDEDVVASLDGIPGLLPRAEFEQRFGDVDSAEYAAMMQRIERNIDRLPLHAE